MTSVGEEEEGLPRGGGDSGTGEESLEREKEPFWNRGDEAGRLSLPGGTEEKMALVVSGEGGNLPRCSRGKKGALVGAGDGGDVPPSVGGFHDVDVEAFRHEVNRCYQEQGSQSSQTLHSSSHGLVKIIPLSSENVSSPESFSLGRRALGAKRRSTERTAWHPFASHPLAPSKRGSPFRFPP